MFLLGLLFTGCGTGMFLCAITLSTEEDLTFGLGVGSILLLIGGALLLIG